MIRTGELTGKLERCCFQLAQQQQEQQRLTEKVKKALRYPIVILTLALALVVAMLFSFCRNLPPSIGPSTRRSLADANGHSPWRRVSPLLAVAAAFLLFHYFSTGWPGGGHAGCC